MNQKINKNEPSEKSLNIAAAVALGLLVGAFYMVKFFLFGG